MGIFDSLGLHFWVRNDTDEEFRLGGSSFQYGQWYHPNGAVSPASRLYRRNIIGWDAGPDNNKTGVQGKVWFGNGNTQITIDFDVPRNSITNYYRTWSTNDRYIVGYSGGEGTDATIQIDISYASEGDKLVPKTGMNESPSAAVLGGKLYVVHRGYEGHQLWYNVLDGDQWAGDKQLGKNWASSSPSAVEFQGKVWVFYQDHTNKGVLWFATLSPDGSCSNGQKVDDMNLSCSPSAVVKDGKIYVFHQGYALDGTLWYNSFDGRNWDGDKKIEGHKLVDSPSAIVGPGNQLHCFYQGTDGAPHLARNSKGDWQYEGIPDTRLSSSPSAVCVKDSIYVFHRAAHNDKRLWCVAHRNGKWQPDDEYYNIEMSHSPSAVFHNGKLYCFHNGRGGLHELWFKSGTEAQFKGMNTRRSEP